MEDVLELPSEHQLPYKVCPNRKCGRRHPKHTECGKRIVAATCCPDNREYSENATSIVFPFGPLTAEWSLDIAAAEMNVSVMQQHTLEAEGIDNEFQLRSYFRSRSAK